MNKRFKKYLGLRQITQKEMASLSGISEMQISRFCNNNIITVKTLLKLLSACDDLSLDYLFFGYGEVLKQKAGDITVNYGSIHNNNNRNEGAGDNSIVIKTSSKDNFHSTDSATLHHLLNEKEKLIAEKDRIISERDATIGRLLASLSPSSTTH